MATKTTKKATTTTAKVTEKAPVEVTETKAVTTAAKTAAKKTATTTATKAAEAPTETKAAEKATATKAPAAEKTTATKAPAKKTAPRKTTPKKAPAKNAAPAPKKTQEVYIQFWGKEVSEADVMNRIQDVWTKDMGKKIEDMIDLRVYIKPEENMAHYVINDDVTGSIEL